MDVEFYGPWHVVFVRAESFPQQGLRIRGSDRSDGLHTVTPGQPWDLHVTGAEWTLTILNQRFFAATVEPGAEVVWQESGALKRRMENVRPGPGLTVTLDTFHIEHGYHTGLELQCICEDPVLNPPMPPIPYDFTYMPQ